MDTKLLEYELVDVSKLIPYANNSRTHTDEQIAKVMASIKEFGFINPILISEDYVITAGHCRLIAAQRLGMEKVPCIKENYLTPSQRKAYVIADNRLALDAGWDEEMLKIELESLGDDGYDIGLTGFDEKELNQLFRENESHEDNFDLSEALKKASFVEKNDIWIVGRHRLMCGDSTKQDDVNALMNDKQADLLLTDPPYGVDYEASNGNKIENDNLDEENLKAFLIETFKCADNVMKKGSPFYIWHADNRRYCFEGACREIGWKVRQNIIWKKNAPTLGRQDYQWLHEPCLYGWKEGASHSWYTGRSEKTVVEFDKPKHNDIHPTMKPVDLFSYQIQNSTKAGDIVLDLFGGSGTAMISCEYIDRVCYLMEFEEKYASAILRRYVENFGDDGNIYCLRNGEKIPYKDLVKEIDDSQA